MPLFCPHSPKSLIPTPTDPNPHPFVLLPRLQIEEQDEGGLTVLKRSTFSLVDLAGSEKWRASLGQAGNAQADVQKEMANIKTSLHVLGTCVSALIEPNRKHIPFRNSVLTRLLQVGE